MPLGLFLPAGTMIFMGTASIATTSVTSIFILLFLNGWFQGWAIRPAAGS
ncbi:MAG: hypothetical protein ACR2PT_09875 [Endozoicomonas sp.]